MAAKYTDFNYLALLRRLEQAILPMGEAQKQRPQTSKDTISRGMKVVRNLREELIRAFSQLAPKRANERKLAANLKLSCERLHHEEAVLIRNIEECAQGLRPRQTFRLAGWPPTVPVETMVAHYVAHVIGLLSENPEGSPREIVMATWVELVAPALAWGIQGQAADRHLSEKEKSELADRIRLHLNSGHLPSETYDLPYLRLTEAWFKILQDAQEDWRLPPHDILTLRQALADMVAQPEMSKLWSSLGAHFAHVLAGSERARAVQLASRHLPDQTKAAFIRDRLVLLEASRLSDVQSVANASRRNPAEAVSLAHAWLQKNRREPAADGRSQSACGMAYWLAHMLYKAHQLGWNPQYDEASRLVTELLALGATCAANPDERILCLRFRAGYSTNPRYYRSRYVIKNARRFVRGYEDTPGAKSGLSDLFMARLFWQLSQSEAIADTRETARQQANRFFIAALNAIEGDKMDSEAPIHLFPEIMVALHAQLENKKGKVSKNNGGSLALLDYLAQRGFGIYFDAPTEAAAIDAGCRQFAEAQKPDPDDGEEAPGEPTKNQETSATPEEAERLAKEDPRMKIAEDQRAGRYRLWDVIALGIKASRRK